MLFRSELIGKDSEAALKKAISDERSITAGEYKQVVHAHWKEVEPGQDILFECSACGRIISTSWGCCDDEDTHGYNGSDPTEEWLCCPSCSAVMDDFRDWNPLDGKDDSHETD